MGAKLFYEAWMRLEVLYNNKQVLSQQLDSPAGGESVTVGLTVLYL